MKKINVFVVFTYLLMAVACGSDDGGSDPDPVTSSDISGSVNLYNAGTQQLDGAGMTVTVEGTNPLKTAVTNSQGAFILSDVSFGTYTLLFSKTGYGDFKMFNVDHNSTTGTLLTEAPSLGETSPTEVFSVDATVNGDEVTIDVSISPPVSNNDPKYLRVFYGTDDTVSNTSFVEASPGIEVRINPSSITVTATELVNLGLQSGSTVYLRVYGDSFFSNEYDDPGLGRSVYPNLNLNSVSTVSFVVP